MEASVLYAGLHDNPWQCDCRLFDLVQFQQSPSSSVAFIDTGLRCAEPESLSGVLFSDAELRKCQAPRVHTAVARVRSSIGKTAALGHRAIELSWSRADHKPMNGTGTCDICISSHVSLTSVKRTQCP